jgi:hypothetical protein
VWQGTSSHSRAMCMSDTSLPPLSPSKLAVPSVSHWRICCAVVHASSSAGDGLPLPCATPSASVPRLLCCGTCSVSSRCHQHSPRKHDKRRAHAKKHSDGDEG